MSVRTSICMRTFADMYMHMSAVVHVQMYRYANWHVWATALVPMHPYLHTVELNIACPIAAVSCMRGVA